MDWTHSPCIGRWSLNHQGSPLQLEFTEYLFCAKSGTSDDLFLVPTFKRASQVAQWVKNPPANAGDTGDLILILGLERSSGGGYGNPLQYSCLENPMNRRVWWATVQRATKSQKQLNTHAHTFKELPFLWGGSRLHIDYVLPLRGALDAQRKDEWRQPRAAENEASQTLKDRVAWAWLSR